MHLLCNPLAIRDCACICMEPEQMGCADIRGDQIRAEWGQQIRNYVLHPYSLVKDVRTKQETSDVDGVLNGDLMPFMQSFLQYRGSQTRRQ